MELHPVRLAIILNKLKQIANEMDIVFERSAFSPVISEALDRASGIYDPDGNLVVQGDTGHPIFIGVNQVAVTNLIRSGKSVQPGDVFIMNDPYLGGTHLMDVRMIAPFFWNGELFGYLANTGHWPDIGGAVPGGFAAQGTEIYAEGLRLPFIKICEQGRLREDLVELILTNVRVPEQRIGDIMAQIASLERGADKLEGLLATYGAAFFREAIRQSIECSQRLMEEEIDRLPPGVYTATARMDGDGIELVPLVIELMARVEPRRIVFDFSRSSPPCRGPMNSVLSATVAAVYVAVKHLFPDIPLNGGCFKPLAVVAPPTTFLNAQPPSPVSGCAAEVSQRIVDVVLRALGPCLPGKAVASAYATSGNLALGGYDPARRRHYVMFFFSGGGYGATAEGDGLTNGCSTIGFSKTPPLEVLEQRFPLQFDYYRLRENSAGAGKFRGGFGVEYQIRLLRGDAVASAVMDRGTEPPAGILGGQPGTTTRVEFQIGEQVYRPPHITKDQGVRLRSGDAIRVWTPGGGGYGDPRERDPGRVNEDITQRYYSPEVAGELYGAGTINTTS